MTSANDRFDRLQRALAAFVAFREEPGGRTDADLLAAHPDLRELLEPMLRGDDEVPRDDDDERPNVTAGMRLGDYALVRELGRGGMGVVFEARQTSLGRRVALKVLHDRLATTPGAVARFRREASAAAALRHPGIAPIYEVGEHDGVHFLAMDFVVGRPLDAVVRDGSLGPPDGAARCRRAAEILADIADALGHAHARGITHLDVKPHNVLLLDDGSVRVVDFGLARDLSWDGDATRRTGVVGTPQYMSPEQARGDPELGPTSDVFSCGLVLCELVSGRRVVAAESVSATLDRVAAAQIAIPHQTARALPRPLRAITERCLAPDAARRYPDGGALAAELRAWLAHRPVAAAAPGLPTRAALSLRRRPVLAAAGLVVALAAGAVAVQRALYEHRVEHAERAGRDGQAGADAATVAALRQLVGVLDDRLARQQQLDEGYRSQLDDAAALAMAQLDRPGADDRFRRQVASALLDAAEVHRRVGDPGAAEPLIAAVLTRIDGAGFVVARARSLQAELALAASSADVDAAAAAACDAWRDVRARAEASDDGDAAATATAALARVTILRARAAMARSDGLDQAARLLTEAAAGIASGATVDRARLLLARAALLLRRQRWADALDAFAAAGELLPTDDGDAGAETDAVEGLRQRQLAGVATALWKLRRYDQADAALAAARAASETFVARFPNDRSGRRALATIGMQQGHLLILRGRPDDAIAPLSESLPAWRALCGVDGATSWDRQAFAVTATQLANCHLLRSPPDPTPARPLYEEALTVFEQLAAAAPRVLSHHSELGACHSDLAAWHNTFGAADDALTHAEAAVRAQSEAAAARPADLRIRRFLALHHAQAAFAHERLGAVDPALGAARRAIATAPEYARSVQMCVHIALRCTRRVDDTAPERVDAIAGEVVAWLRGLAAGNARGVRRLLDDRRLGPLRDREDFRALRASLDR